MKPGWAGLGFGGFPRRGRQTHEVSKFAVNLKYPGGRFGCPCALLVPTTKHLQFPCLGWREGNGEERELKEGVSYYLVISYLWIYFGPRRILLSELQILPYLTNQAFDVGEIRGCAPQPLPNEDGSECICAKAWDFKRSSKTTFKLGQAHLSQKTKIIGSA